MVPLQHTDVNWGPVHLKACLVLCCAVNLGLDLHYAMFTHAAALSFIRFVGLYHDPRVHLSKHRHPAAVNESYCIKPGLMLALGSKCLSCMKTEIMLLRLRMRMLVNIVVTGFLVWVTSRLYSNFDRLITCFKAYLL